MNRRHMLGLVGVAAVAILTVACTSSSNEDGGSGGSGGSATGGASGAAPSKTLPMKVGTACVCDSSQDLFTALDAGFFAKAGLDATLVKINSSGQLAAALLSGSADIAQGSGVAVATADMKGQDLVMIGFDQTQDNSNYWAPVSVKSVADLKGKSVGATSPGSNGDLEMSQLLKRNGLKKSDVTHRYLGTEAAEVAALRAGSIAAAGLSDTAGSVLANDKQFHIIASSAGIPFPYHVWAVSAKYLANHKEEVRRFVAAENAALSYIHDPANAATVTKSIVNYTKVTDTEQADHDRAHNLAVKEPKLVLPMSLVKLSFELASEAGAGSVPADISKYADPSFINQS